jgi:hypothetical protein
VLGKLGGFGSLLAVTAIVTSAGLLAAGGRSAATAQAQQAGPGWVGAWLNTVTLGTGGPPTTNLSINSADGTLIDVNAPAAPAPPGAPYQTAFASTGIGSWASLGGGSAGLSFVVLRTDEAGNSLGTVTVRGIGQLSADGQTASGSGQSTIAGPAGQVLATVPFTVQSTRVRAEAPAGTSQPAGSAPAASPGNLFGITIPRP